VSVAPAVEIAGLVMKYGEKVAVDHLDLTIARHTITAVLGPNGAGKTTTLETCEGYRKPDQGTVRVLDLDPQADRRRLLPKIGVMLQQGGAWSGVHGVEMLRYMASLHANPLPIDLLVERLGLQSLGRTPYRRLSGGQQQRLSLAMAIIGRPELIFVDEPTAGMDPAARRTTWELLNELNQDGVSVVLTTHYMDEAEALADQIHIIDSGRLIASGTPAELTQSGATHIRLVVKSALNPDAPMLLQAELGPDTTIRQLNDVTLLLTGHADSTTLAKVSNWCERHAILPDSLNLGQRNLEDVFLELTGRELMS